MANPDVGGATIDPVGGADHEGLHSVIALAAQGSSTLGFLPKAAYEDAAQRGGILAARHEGSIVGFALFAATSRWIRLVQLYVRPDRRGRGVARELVESIAQRHSGLPGIKVTCRQDYGLAAAWTALGFRRGGELRGRGRDQAILVQWWRDNNHPRLFDWNRSEVLVRASVDFNVLRDLDDERRPSHSEALALTGDQIADRLELVRTGALDVEVDGLDDPASRARCALRARDLVYAPSPGVARLEAGLRATVPAEFVAQRSGELDVRYVAEAVAAGLSVLVTQDRGLQAVAGDWAAERGLRILTPSDVVVHIDELAHAGAYRPAAIADTAFRVQRLGAGSDDLLLTLVNAPGGEQVAALRRKIKDLTARGVARYGVVAPDGTLVAAYLTDVGPSLLEVPLLRIAHGPLSDTLVRQILFSLRSDARKATRAVIRLADPHLASAARAAALDDGFLDADGALVALVLDVCGTARSVHDAACAAARAAGIPEPAKIRGLVPEVVAGVERAWWPARIVDGPLPTYLVPIQQRFSTPLLGYPAGLFARDDLLGLRREHVYYRSPTAVRPSSPGRILWYVSGSGHRNPSPSGIVACSSLDEVIEGDASDLHERFRHLGVWRVEQVLQASRDGKAQALHFSGTEVFPTMVSLSRMRALGVQHPVSPRRISRENFAALYREGARRG
jgi:GNAT superfamily N-acetyltransferase